MTNQLPTLLWLVPLLPFLAAGITAFMPDSQGKLASKIALAALGTSCLIAIGALFLCCFTDRARSGDCHLDPMVELR